MKNIAFTSLFVCFCLCKLFSQDFNHYENQKCSGEVPPEFLILSSEKYHKESDQISQHEKRKTRNIQRDFYLQSNYAIDGNLKSGRVIFNDAFSEYVKLISDYILKDNAKLKNDLRIYTVRSATANAFTTNNGIVFVNLGLLARLESEAQLAFVLCHEYQHFVKKHVLKRYENTKSYTKKNISYGNKSYLDGLLERSNYSKKQETEADKLGLDLFLNTEYNPTAASSTFDVLLRSNMPFDDRKFRWDFLGNELIKWPEDLYLESIEEIDIDEDYNDSLASHPNIFKRKEYISEELVIRDRRKGRDFIFGEERFKQIRKMARFELCQIYLSQKRYEEALYHCFLLMEDNPDSYYLKKTVARILYVLSKYKNRVTFHQVHTNDDDVLGKSKDLYHSLYYMEYEDLNSISLRYCYNLHKSFPEDDEIEKMTIQLFEDLGYYHQDFATNELYRGKKDWLELVKNLKDSIKIQNDILLENFNKKYNAQNLKDDELGEIQTKEVNIEGNDLSLNLLSVNDLLEEQDIRFISPVFASEFNDTLFKNYFKKYVEDIDEIYEDDENRYGYYDSSKRKKKHKLKIALGIDKIVFVDPFFQKIDTRKKIPLRYEYNESGKDAYQSFIKECSANLSLQTEVISVEGKLDTDVEAFNDFSLLNQWIAERYEHDSPDDILPMYAEDMGALADKYGTDYFAWGGIISLTYPRNKGMTILIGAMTIYGLPIALGLAFVPCKRTYQYLMLLNIRTGELVLQDVNLYSTKPRKDYLRSTLYSTLLKINSVPKK